MKLVTAKQLSNLKEQNLRDLFLLASRQLAVTEPETFERSIALGSLENISHALALRCR